MADKVRLRIQRRDGPDDSPRWESFEVDPEPLQNVISCLQQILARRSPPSSGSAPASRRSVAPAP